MAELDLPAVGAKAPPFCLPASTGGTVDLCELAARGPVVLFFYPKADTPGCTKQACGFRDDMSAFRDAGVSVVGISPDALPAVQKFAKKFALDYPLLADEDHVVAERYGVWREKSMYGRKFMGVVRTTIVVDNGGKVANVYERVKPEGHSREVLHWLRSRSD